MRVNRNHFGRQTESFQTLLDLPFLRSDTAEPAAPFPAVFIRAPVVEKILATPDDAQSNGDNTVTAPSRQAKDELAREAMGSRVEVLATLPGRAAKLASEGVDIRADKEAGDIIAVRQGNVFGTSFHPELTGDARIHSWWLDQVLEAVGKSRQAEQ